MPNPLNKSDIMKTLPNGDIVLDDLAFYKFNYMTGLLRDNLITSDEIETFVSKLPKKLARSLDGLYVNYAIQDGAVIVDPDAIYEEVDSIRTADRMHLVFRKIEPTKKQIKALEGIIALDNNYYCPSSGKTSITWNNLIEDLKEGKQGNRYVIDAMLHLTLCSACQENYDNMKSSDQLFAAIQAIPSLIDKISLEVHKDKAVEETIKKGLTRDEAYAVAATRFTALHSLFFNGPPSASVMESEIRAAHENYSQSRYFSYKAFTEDPGFASLPQNIRTGCLKVMDSWQKRATEYAIAKQQNGRQKRATVNAPEQQKKRS